jgi:hypothetical protein
VIDVKVDASETRAALRAIADGILDGTRGTLTHVGIAVVEHAAKYPHLFTPRTGELQRNFGWRLADSTSVRVSSSKKYSAPLYFGSRAHTITAKKAKCLRWVSSGGQVHFAKSVQHPGNSARPFFQSAAEYGQQLLAWSLEQMVTEQIERAA